MEKKQKFEGSVSGTLPRNIIPNNDEVEKIDGLFITFALIFNDIKTIHLLSMVIEENFEALDSEEKPTYHKGEFAGVGVYLIRMLFGTINEFLILLEKKQTVIKEDKFQNLLKNLSSDTLLAWNGLYNLGVSKNKTQKDSDPVLSLIDDIRNEISFHYYGGPKYLSEGFKDFFYKNPPKPQNKRAFYSIGETMKDTRFFYADAAAEAYLAIKAEKYGYDRESFKAVIFKDLVSKLNLALSGLIRVYIKSKK